MNDRAHLAQRLRAGLNGDPDQRAATTLLTEAVHGIWLTKLSGHDQYIVASADPRTVGALWIDWHTLREDLSADHTARAAFHTWTQSWEGSHAGDEQFEAKWHAMVPDRPWHGASSSELSILRMAVDLAPGGPWGEGISRFDPNNRAAVLAAVAELVEGQHLPPDGHPQQPLPRRAAQPPRAWRSGDANSHRPRGL